MMSTHRLPAVSFVVPVKNDEARLRLLLQSIRASERASGVPAEVIVVDNGSSDRSAAVASELDARVMVVPLGNVASLRNVGARSAQAGVVAFVDADHTIDPAWLAVAVDTFGNPAVAAAGALCQAPPHGTWVQRAYDRLRRRPTGIRAAEWLGSGNLLVRTAVFDAVGGFDTTLETCEDVDLCRRVREQGHTLISDDRLKNVHWGDPATLRALFLGELWRGRDNLRVTVRSGIASLLSPSALIPVCNIAALAALALCAALPGRAPLYVMCGAFAVLAITVAARVGAMIVRPSGGLSTGDLGSTILVASVYELARALALVSHTGHRARRSGGRGEP